MFFSKKPHQFIATPQLGATAYAKFKNRLNNSDCTLLNDMDVHNGLSEFSSIIENTAANRTFTKPGLGIL